MKMCEGYRKNVDLFLCGQQKEYLNEIRIIIIVLIRVILYDQSLNDRIKEILNLKNVIS